MSFVRLCLARIWPGMVRMKGANGDKRKTRAVKQDANGAQCAYCGAKGTARLQLSPSADDSLAPGNLFGCARCDKSVCSDHSETLTVKGNPVRACADCAIGYLLAMSRTGPS